MGIVGPTGSGKSTFADLFMGLLIPTNGKILVDDIDIHNNKQPDNIEKWRAAIGHVPQTIYLSDSSFLKNIAFAEPEEKIDYKKVYECAVSAQIHEFILSTKDGYNTRVGERGIMLSGGQRQRIGIARALYKNSSLLVLDEATSALDEHTEERVMSSVDNLSRTMTILMITHRLSTLKYCDRIIKL